MNSGRNHTQFVPWWQFHCTDQRHHASCSSDSWTSESNVQVDVSAYLHLSSISSCYPPVLVMFSGHWRGHVRHVTSECLMVSPWNRGSSACLPSSNNARSNWKNSPHHTEMTTWVRIGLKFKKTPNPTFVWIGLIFEKNKCQQNGFWYVFPLNKPSHQYNHYDKYHQSLVTSLLPGPSRCLDNWVCAMRPQIRLELFPQLPSGESTPDTPKQLVHPLYI